MASTWAWLLCSSGELLSMTRPTATASVPFLCPLGRSAIYTSNRLTGTCSAPDKATHGATQDLIYWPLCLHSSHLHFIAAIAERTTDARTHTNGLTRIHHKDDCTAVGQIGRKHWSISLLEGIDMWKGSTLNCSNRDLLTASKHRLEHRSV